MIRSAFRRLGALLLVLALAVGICYLIAGRGARPVLTINQPSRAIGQIGMLDLTAEAPNARFTTLAVVLEQDDKTVPLFCKPISVSILGEFLNEGCSGRRQPGVQVQGVLPRTRTITLEER